MGGGAWRQRGKIAQNAVFRGKRPDNTILKVHILLSRNFVVIAQAPKLGNNLKLHSMSVLPSSTCYRQWWRPKRMRWSGYVRTSVCGKNGPESQCIVWAKMEHDPHQTYPRASQGNLQPCRCSFAVCRENHQRRKTTIKPNQFVGGIVARMLTKRGSSCAKILTLQKLDVQQKRRCL